jgi:NADH dehydrogenase
MKVFVTGATGFVGKAVIKALRARDHEVVGLVRDANKGRALEQLGVTLAVGDMLKPASVWYPGPLHPQEIRAD